eukprot:646586_1
MWQVYLKSVSHTRSVSQKDMSQQSVSQKDMSQQSVSQQSVSQIYVSHKPVSHQLVSHTKSASWSPRYQRIPSFELVSQTYYYRRLSVEHVFYEYSVGLVRKIVQMTQIQTCLRAPGH